MNILEIVATAATVVISVIAVLTYLDQRKKNVIINRDYNVLDDKEIKQPPPEFLQEEEELSSKEIEEESINIINKKANEAYRYINKHERFEPILFYSFFITTLAIASVIGYFSSSILAGFIALFAAGGAMYLVALPILSSKKSNLLLELRSLNLNEDQLSGFHFKIWHIYRENEKEGSLKPLPKHTMLESLLNEAYDRKD